MAVIGQVVIGAVAAIRNDESGMGKEFKEGLHSIGPPARERLDPPSANSRSPDSATTKPPS